jgi:hypothetical protein
MCAHLQALIPGARGLIKTGQGRDSAALLSMLTRVSLDARSSEKASENAANCTSAPVSTCGLDALLSSEFSCKKRTARISPCHLVSTLALRRMNKS